MKSSSTLLCLGVVVVGRLATGQQTNWSQPINGNWTDTDRWSDGVPTPVIDALIAATGSPYTIRIGSEAFVRNLAIASESATLRIDSGGALNITNAAGLGAGEIMLDNGVIRGGTLALLGGRLRVSRNRENALDGTSVIGNIDLDDTLATLSLRNRARMTGVLRLSGEGARLGLEGQQAFNGTLIADGIATRLTLENDADAIIAEGATIMGGDLTIGGSFGLFTTSRRLENDGTIAATRDTVRFGLIDDLTNNGVIVADNATVHFQDSIGLFRHTGTLRVLRGGSIDLDEIDWVNNGRIEVEDGVFRVNGNYTSTTLGLTDGRLSTASAGRVDLFGDIDNTGQTARLVCGDGITRIRGTITGGTIVAEHPDRIHMLGRTTLNAVSWVGDAALNASSGELWIDAQSEIDGDVVFAAADGRVLFDGFVSFDNTIRQEAAAPRAELVALNGLTLGETARVDASELKITGARFTNDGAMSFTARNSSIQAVVAFANNGVITVRDGAGLGIATRNWTNDGQIVLEDGTLELSNRYSSASIGLGDGRISSTTESTLVLRGTLANEGQTFGTSSFAGMIIAPELEVRGGVFEVGDAARFSASGLTLDDSVFRGSATLRRLVLRNAADIDGVISLGAAALVQVESSLELSGGLRNLQGGSSAELWVTDDASEFVLGASSSVVVSDLLLRGVAGSSGQTRRLVNNGEIAAIYAGASNDGGVQIRFFDMVTNRGGMTAGSNAEVVLTDNASIINEGQMSVEQDGLLQINDGFINSVGGRIELRGGELQLDGAWRNDGSIIADNGTVTLDGQFHSSSVAAGKFSATDTLVTIRGAVDNQGGHLAIASLGGRVHLSGASITGGVVQTPMSGSLSINATTFDGVSILGDMAPVNAGANFVYSNGTSVSGTTIVPRLGRLTIDSQTPFGGEVVASEGGRLIFVDGGVLDETALVRGRGLIIEGGGRLENFGTISAIGPTGSVSIRPAEGFVNHGVLEAVNGGSLFVSIDSAFPNLDNGVIATGLYRVGEGSEMSLGGNIIRNSATIELLGAGSTLVGIETLERNSGRLTLAGSLEVTLAGDLQFEQSSMFEVRVQSNNSELAVPRLAVHGAASVGGTLILDFAGIDAPIAGTYTFLSAAELLGVWDEIIVVGIDNALISTSRVSGQFVVVPTPSAALAALALGAWAGHRRTRRGAPHAVATGLAAGG